MPTQFLPVSAYFSTIVAIMSRYVVILWPIESGTARLNYFCLRCSTTALHWPTDNGRNVIAADEGFLFLIRWGGGGPVHVPGSYGSRSSRLIWHKDTLVKPLCAKQHMKSSPSPFTLRVECCERGARSRERGAYCSKSKSGSESGSITTTITTTTTRTRKRTDPAAGGVKMSLPIFHVKRSPAWRLMLIAASASRHKSPEWRRSGAVRTPP